MPVVSALVTLKVQRERQLKKIKARVNERLQGQRMEVPCGSACLTPRRGPFTFPPCSCDQMDPGTGEDSSLRVGGELHGTTVGQVRCKGGGF